MLLKKLKMTCLGKASCELVWKSVILRRWLLSVYRSCISVVTFPASSEPFSIQTGPQNPNWLWLVYSITVWSEFSGFFVHRLPQFVSSLKSRGDSVSNQGLLFSPKWHVFPPVSGSVPTLLLLSV